MKKERREGIKMKMESTKTGYKESIEQDRGKGKEEAKDGRETQKESNVGEKR